MVASKHLSFSLVTGLLVLGGLTVGFASAETESPLPTYAHMFVLPFANNITEGEFAGAKFDISAFMNHPCFQIAGTEADMCKTQFGVTTSLKSFLDDGSLIAYLRTQGIVAGGVTSSASSSSMSSTGSTMSSSSSSSSMMSSSSSSVESSSSSSNNVQTIDVIAVRQQRSDLLWSICSEMEKNDRAATADCYQRNMSLLQRLNVPLRGNVF